MKNQLHTINEWLLSCCLQILLFIGQELKEEEQITWCTVTLEEQYKCQNLTKALERDRALFKEDFLTLKCLQGFNKQDCMTLLDSEKAHFVTLDAGDVFIAGRYNSLIPIMQVHTCLQQTRIIYELYFVIFVLYL